MSSKTKEEILSGYNNWLSEDPNGKQTIAIPFGEVEKAMDDFAKERSIAFAEWVEKNATFNSKRGMWIHYTSVHAEKALFTTAELYDIFLIQSI